MAARGIDCFVSSSPTPATYLWWQGRPKPPRSGICSSKRELLASCRAGTKTCVRFCVDRYTYAATDRLATPHGGLLQVIGYSTLLSSQLKTSVSGLSLPSCRHRNQ